MYFIVLKYIKNLGTCVNISPSSKKKYSYIIYNGNNRSNNGRSQKKTRKKITKENGQTQKKITKENGQTQTQTQTQTLKHFIKNILLNIKI